MERQTVQKAEKTPARVSQLHPRLGRSSAAAHPIFELQRSIGNQAVQGLIRSPYIQTKLQVSTPEDPSEQEADRVADTVMRMPEPTVSRQVLAQSQAAQITPLAQREFDEDAGVVAPKSKLRIPVAVREDGEEEETSVQRVCDECEEEMVHRAEGGEEEEAIQTDDARGTKSHPSAINQSVARSIGSLKGHGSPLSEATRSFFEPRFGTDFGQVRVHTDSQASETAKSINAKAFTVGQNIAFGSGQYAPHSQEGRQLLAHELTHVLHQSASHRYQSGQAAQSLQDFPHRWAISTDLTALQPGLVQRDKGDPKANKAAVAQRAKVEAAIQNLKTKYGIANVSEEKGETWTEAQLKTVDAAFAKMSSEEQAKLKGLTLIRTDKLSVERKGKKIEVVAMAGETWIRFTKKAFSTNMVTLHEVGHVIHKKVVREVEEKVRKSKVFTDVEAADRKFNESVKKNPRVIGSTEQIAFANSINQLTIAGGDLLNSGEADRTAKQDLLNAAQADADVARMPVEQNPKDPVSKILLERHDLQKVWVAAVEHWLNERDKAVLPRRNLTEFVAIVNKHKLARKSFAPFTDYVAKFWPDEPGEFFAESYAMWRSQPKYMKDNAKPLFEWFERKGHLAP